MIRLRPRAYVPRYALIVTVACISLLNPHAALAGPLLFQAELVTTGLSTFNFDGGAVAVSANGSTALVAARRYNNDAGLVTVFIRTGGAWTKQASLAPSDLAAGDDFGTSVALSGDGNTAFVGAPYRTASSGIVYVFSRSGTTWTQLGALSAAIVTAGDSFGGAVALSADASTAAIGIPGRASGSNSGVGAVALFTRSGATYTAGPILTASDGAAYDNFGAAVAINQDGTVIVAGAAAKANATGAVYVFTGSGASYTGQTLARGDAITGDAFGADVAVSATGATVLVGAPHKTIGANSNAGAAYVYAKSGASYLAAPTLSAADGQPNDQYGATVALSGDASIAGIAAPYRNSNTGAVYTLTGSGGAYTASQTLTGSVVSGANGYVFGTGLDLSGDGTTAIVGAPGKNQNTGTAYAFFSGASPPPTITGVTPASGPLIGGTTIAITGMNFQDGARVNFGTLASPHVTRVSATQLNVIVPASMTSTVVALTVTNSDGQTATRPQGYAYVTTMPIPSHIAQPTISGMAPYLMPNTHPTGPPQGQTAPTPNPQPMRHP